MEQITSFTQSCVTTEIDIEDGPDFYNSSPPFISARYVEFPRYLDVLLQTDELDFRIRNKVKDDLINGAWDLHPQQRPAEKVLIAAFNRKYQIVTRFFPPYCSTVTLYKDTIGFVTFSRLCDTFDETPVNLEDKNEHQSILFATRGALEVLDSIYTEFEKQPHKRRTREQHLILHDRHHEKPRPMFIRNEENSVAQTQHFELTRVDETAAESDFSFKGSLKRLWKRCLFRLALLANYLISRSRISFDQGPATIMNDYLNDTHKGRYARNIRIIDGQISVQLTLFGRALAVMNLYWVNAVVTAAVTLGTVNTENAQSLLPRIALPVLLGLQLYQWLWTIAVAPSDFESIFANDFRLRHKSEAGVLLGLSLKEFKTFLAMVSPHVNIKGHGHDNSYVNFSSTGGLEVNGSIPIDVLYLAGYITTNMSEEQRLPIAACVKYDTYTPVYGTIDPIRRLSKNESRYHLSGSRRTNICYDESQGKMILKHDNYNVKLPHRISIVGGGEVG